MKLKKVLLILALIGGASSLLRSSSCGKRSGVVGTIFGGAEVKKNSWPWIVALYNRPQKKFFCAGTLISQKHVLSAAHCFQNKGQLWRTQPEYVAALLGKHDLNVNRESGSKQFLVWDTILHPDWNFNTERFDADIAIVFLIGKVELSKQIQPVCLPRSSFNEVVGNGVVVGWGKSENSGSNRHDSILNELMVPAVNASHCYTTFYLLGSVSSNRAFCGGYDHQGRAPCLGDSGGGFYLLDPAARTWNVRGIVSASIIDFDIGCDINTYSIYTNVATFVQWIDNVKDIEWNYVEFKCTKDIGQGSPIFKVQFDTDCHHSYSGPFSRNLKIRPRFDQHPTIKSADYVRSLVLYFGNSTRIFAGISEVFRNLEALWIHDRSLLFLERSNFAKLPKLTRLELLNKQIEFIAEDTFWDLPNLESLNIFKCEIGELSKHLLANSRKLRYFDARFNKFRYLDANVFRNNLLMEEIDLSNNQLQVIDFDFTKLPKLMVVTFDYNDCIDEKYSAKYPLTSTVATLQELMEMIYFHCKLKSRHSDQTQYEFNIRKSGK